MVQITSKYPEPVTWRIHVEYSNGEIQDTQSTNGIPDRLGKQKPDRAGIYPKAHLCWKGYDFGILNKLTDEGLVNAGDRSKSASFNAEGEAKARKLLKAHGIEVDTSE